MKIISMDLTCLVHVFFENIGIEHGLFSRSVCVQATTKLFNFMLQLCRNTMESQNLHKHKTQISPK